MRLENFLHETNDELKAGSLWRRLRPVEGAQSAQIYLEGKPVLNFCSNNYLGLADDERLKQAAIASIEEEGFGTGASRLVCGNLKTHQLERRVTSACAWQASAHRTKPTP